mgnify:CR=1 FL=1
MDRAKVYRRKGKCMNISEKVYSDFCYGCGACRNICPVNAVEIEEDGYGFLKARTDNDKCIDCEKCLSVCPRLYNEYDNWNTPECYAAWAKDGFRSTAASGGIFSAIAYDFLVDEDHYIVGAVWKEDYYVHHIVTNNRDDICKIRNSKYVQSNTDDTYCIVKSFLKEGKRVLYCGCPCQIAGLYAYLGEKNRNLYTIDLICHGVPSTKILQKYLYDTYNVKDIKKLDFRDKSVFGWSTEMNVYMNNGQEIHTRASNDSFYEAFLSNLSLNPNCENCQFSRLPRQGDISIGDFWDIEKFDKKLNDGKGTSLVLINNEHGKELYESCKSIAFSQSMPLQFVQETCNKTVFEPFKHHFGSKRFLNDFSRMDFKKAVYQSKNFKYDIGLVTTWFARNFGAIFTAYALYKYLENVGYSVLMIRKPKELWTEGYNAPQRNPIAVDFGNKMYQLSKEYSLEDIPNISLLNNSCNTFLVGSDQLWNPKVYAYKYYFFLDFVNAEKRKISYATSIGASRFEGSEVDKHNCAYFLKRFDAISNREDEAVQICKNEFSIEAQKVIDPVFLLDRHEYEELAANSGLKENDKYIFTYILDGNLDKKRIIDFVSKKLGYKIVCAYDIERPEYSKKIMGYEEASIERPEDWLNYIKNAEFVITDSYHGGCFATIFQKQFMCFINPLRGENRFKELFGRLGLQRHLLSNESTEDDVNWIINNTIDYRRVNEIINEERGASCEWLQKSLTISKKPMGTEEFVLKEVDKRQKLKDRDSLQVYKSMQQLGCSKGVSVQEIMDRMPEGSYLQQVQGNYDPIVDTPMPFGVLSIKKTTNYFVEVQFTQMTYKSKRPQLYIGNVVENKIVGWERFVSEAELRAQIEKLQEQINLLIDNDNETK